MSSDWIVVVSIAVLLAIVTAYSVFLAFWGSKDEEPHERGDRGSRDQAEPMPKGGRKAA